MKANVFVPEGMHSPNLFTRRLSLFANGIYNVVTVGLFIRSLYSRDTPVVGLRTSLITLVRCSDRLWIARMLATTAYLLETFWLLR